MVDFYLRKKWLNNEKIKEIIYFYIKITKKQYKCIQVQFKKIAKKVFIFLTEEGVEN